MLKWLNTGAAQALCPGAAGTGPGPAQVGPPPLGGIRPRAAPGSPAPDGGLTTTKGRARRGRAPTPSDGGRFPPVTGPLSRTNTGWWPDHTRRGSRRRAPTPGEVPVRVVFVAAGTAPEHRFSARFPNGADPAISRPFPAAPIPLELVSPPSPPARATQPPHPAMAPGSASGGQANGSPLP
ncbi:hypothetical protein Aglo01_41830 [Actinokineospora globicatena]|nr:hypothetical protein Aglo01_41830 [Actinokineospora globicatena]GLW85888.1 hypothetical protein Aglo02_35280 [Actinokineospora globicatena]